MQITYASKHGKTHNGSQDCILVNDKVINNYAGSINAKLEKLCIADGVGGVPGGYEASSFVLSSFAKCKNIRSGDEIRKALLNINDSLIEYASTMEEKRAMATTFSGMFACEDRIWIMHAGNSRIYSVTQGNLTQLTTDQTNYQALVAEGAINETSVEYGKNVIYCCFGTGNNKYLNALEVFELVGIKPPEYFIFTTDGIHDYIDDVTMSEILEDNYDDRNKILALINEAEKNGSSDDCTVVIARRKMI